MAITRCERLYFLETPFDVLSQGEVLKFLAANEHRYSPFRYIVTPNADHVVRNKERVELLPIYEGALFSVCDSRVVARLAKLKGFPINEVITGSDLTRDLFSQVLRPAHRITVIGCDAESVTRLKADYRLEHVYHHNPKMGFIHDESAVLECCRFVADHPSDFVLIAVGSPQQEILAARLKATPRATGIGLCIGASLLFLTGQEKRAPLVFSRLGIEWLFRLSQDPKRLWRRYMHDLKIFSHVFRSPAHDGLLLLRELD